MEMRRGYNVGMQRIGHEAGLSLMLLVMPRRYKI